MRLRLAAALLLAPAIAAGEDMPAPIAERTEAALAECRESGGNPTLTPDYLRSADLNGDGRPDYLVDFAGLACAGAWSYFCGSAGCPVFVWLSDGDTHRLAWNGPAQEAAIDGAEIVLQRHGQTCTPPRPGFEGCEERLAFTGRAPAPEPAAVPAPAARPAGLSLPERQRPEPGWSLRDVPGTGPLALAGGPGSVHSVSAFCLGGSPFLALDLEPRPQAATVEAAFAFSASRYAAEALGEDGAGGAYVIALAGNALASLLAGADAEASLAIDGAAQGTLSLRGSTRALRAALAPCNGLP